MSLYSTVYMCMVMTLIDNIITIITCSLSTSKKCFIPTCFGLRGTEMTYEVRCLNIRVNMSHVVHMIHSVSIAAVFEAPGRVRFHMHTREN